MNRKVTQEDLEELRGAILELRDKLEHMDTVIEATEDRLHARMDRMETKDD